jgi:hypothetical protein
VATRNSTATSSVYESESESYITANLGLTTILLLLSDCCGFIDMGRSLSEKRTGLSFTISVGPRQRRCFLFGTEIS